MNNEKAAIRDARKLGIPKMLLLGFQHMFAMFGATILVPLLVNNYFEGEGTLIIYNGSTYTGQFYHDKYHGKGVITTTIKKENSKPIEQKFDGTFDNGVGKGTYYLGDGNKLIEVPWKNNKLKDGECIKVYPQGNKERGYWKEGHFTAK